MTIRTPTARRPGSPARAASCAARSLLLGLLLALMPGPMLHAQQVDGGEVDPDVLSVESVKARLDALAQDTLIAETDLAALRELWQRSLERLESAQRWVAVKADFVRRTSEAPQQLVREKERRESGSVDPSVDLPTNASLDELEGSLRLATEDLQRRTDELAALELRIGTRAERRAEVPRRLAELRGQDSQPEPTQADADDPLLGPVRRVLKRATAAGRDAEIAALEAEREYYESSGELLLLQRDLAERERDRAAAAAAAWSAAASRARDDVAEAAVTAARARLASVPAQRPKLTEVAERVLALTLRRRGFSSRMSDMRGRLAALRADRLSVETLRREAARRIEAAGYTHTVSLMLRRQRTELPGYLRYQVGIRELAIESDDLHLEILDWELERRSMARLDIEVARLVASESAALVAAGRAPLGGVALEEYETLARDVLTAQRGALDPLVTDGNVLFNLMADLEIEVVDLSRLVAEQLRFIDEHVLWVRSAGALRWADLARAAAGLFELPQLTDWPALSGAWEVLSEHQAARVAWSVGLALLLLVARMLARGQIRRLGQRQPKRRTAPVGPTVVVSALTLLRAAWWPAVAGLLGGLVLATGAQGFLAALGGALQRLPLAILPVALLIETCRPLGLAEAHLGWSANALRSVRRQARLVQFVVLPALLLALALDEGEGHTLRDSLGRLALMLALIGLGVFARNLLTRGGPVYQTLRAQSGDGWLLRLRPLWYPFVVLGPITLAGAVALGYSYAGLQVGQAMIHSWLLVLGLLVAYQLAVRWISMARLRLRLAQMQRRRELQADQEARSLELSGEIQAVVEDGGEERDVAEISAQASRVLNIVATVGFALGLALIWADLLPALNSVGDVALWSTRIEAVEDGMAATLQDVSVRDVLLAALLLVLTVVGGRNIPGLLEITVLRRVTLEPGGGYAITTICRYLVTLAGVVAAASLVGITWDSVQWLAAAVSVGLGFGLQEIFANFVSGLIILFERPIRVGDIVTVGGIEGVVTRIRTRATTIRDRDRRELLVPNREFITGQLVNWTLTDPISRLVLGVGIAYGSDTELAERTLMEVARACRLVLENPAPQIIFRSFGESTLDYEIRVFIADRDYWPQVTHELNTAIHDAFAEAGIEIAFPQRDIHVRTMGPGASGLGRPSAD